MPAYEKKQRRVGKVLVFCGSLTAGILLFLHDPSSTSFFVPCLFRQLTGFYCAGCGSLRALHHILHGDIPRAWKMNPLLVAFLPFFGVLVLVPRIRYSRWIPAVVAVVVIAYTILRNVPAWPFVLLAPSRD